jgi:hypothetical protein
MSEISAAIHALDLQIRMRSEDVRELDRAAGVLDMRGEKARADALYAAADAAEIELDALFDRRDALAFKDEQDAIRKRVQAVVREIV